MRKKNKDKAEHSHHISTFNIYNQSYIHFIMIGIIFVLISIIFFRFGFLNYVPKAYDTEQWKFAAHQTIEYNKEKSQQALWTDNLFSGMPTYQLQFPPCYPFLNNIFSVINSWIDWKVAYLFFGALGMYLLLIYFKFHPLVALISALSFGLSCHFIGLLEIGHNTKFRAIMYLPWIFLTFDDLRKNRRLMSIGLFAIFIICQLRVNHFQISYYTYIALFIYWLVFLVRSIKSHNMSRYYKFTLFIVLSLVIAILGVANPYLSTYEYSKYTIRGGAGGLDPTYATNWSFGITEIFSFLIPNFYGGISPYYWGPTGPMGPNGQVPSTQTFHYMGVLIFFLAFLGILFNFRKTKVKALMSICIVALMISFGKYLPWLSYLLLNYLPLFNQFRVPAMALSIVQFCFPVLAAYGLNTLLKNKELYTNRNSLEKKDSEIVEKKYKKICKVLFFSLLGIIFFVFLLYISGNDLIKNLKFIRNSELVKYTTQQIISLQQIRLKLFLQSAYWSMGILFMGLLCLWLMMKNYCKKNLALIILVCLAVLDLFLVNRNHFKPESLVKESLVSNDFPHHPTDDYLLNDHELFRIYPFHDFGNSRWSYYHQSIGGYHGAKLARYQDIIDYEHGCLYTELDVGVPINWNIINMLNVKYIIFQERVFIPNEDIEFIPISGDTQNYIYRNHAVLPRAWFVKNGEVIKDKNRIFLRLNDPDFDPQDSVILENELPLWSYDENYHIELKERNIHYTKWETNADSTSLMVISEIYYPAGWNVYINGKKTNVYPANYILRALVVPPGTNTIEMKFESPIYAKSRILSMIGLSLSVLITFLGVIMYYLTNYGKGTVYKFTPGE